MSRRAPAGATPTNEPTTERERLAATFTAWRETMLSVKGSVDEATAAVELLRATVREMAPLWRSLGQLEQSLAGIDWAEAMDGASEVEESLAKATSPQPQALPVPEETAAPEPERRDIPRTEAAEDERAAPEPEERDIPRTEAAEDAAPVFSGRAGPLARLDLPTLDGGAPYSYTVTVEEVGAKVKLVPLHQSLSQVEGVRELSLKSYTNGVAAISVDSEVELEASALEEAITTGMDKTCRVMSGDGPTFLVRMGDSPASGRRRQEGSAG
jgi:hypothetical protein